jgi:hypothetical protein
MGYTPMGYTSIALYFNTEAGYFYAFVYEYAPMGYNELLWDLLLLDILLQSS